MSKKIDIIIPVYNGYDDLVLCFESILKHTDFSLCRVIFVNDASPDERILPLLKSFESKGAMLIDSKKNGGFSASVNLGMSQSSENDVILLNSDTIVTANWVEKMNACAYSAEEIGTVTPLSNAATLCSYPVFCQDNKIGKDEIDPLADAVEKSSLQHYPKITVAVGFCMYIKRSVINAIGLFDSATFGRGYGEENDFCNRAEQVGYINVMCDDTFIYHKGTGSFPTEEKKNLIEQHTKILYQRYPEQMKDNDLYVSKNPEQYIRDNITVQRIITNGRKNIMYVLHYDFQEDAVCHVGGTQFHVKDLVEGLCRTSNIIVVARDPDILHVTVYSDDYKVDFQFDIGQNRPLEIYHNRDLAELFHDLLVGFSVDIVHVHHVLSLSLDIFTEAHNLGIPIITTLHDYHFICPTINMWDTSCNFCGEKGKNTTYCNSCLSERKICAEGVPYIKRWREENLKALELSSKILTPSCAAKAIYEEYFPSLKGKITVVPHGLSLSENEDIISKFGSMDAHKKKKPAKRLKVAFVGALSAEKGGALIEKLVKKNSQISWYLFGYSGCPNRILKLLPNFKNVGKYVREELPYLLKKYEIDVVFILSVWPETFSYTLSEAVLAGIPTIGIDIGAVGERIRNDNIGWVVSSENSVEEISALVRELKKSPGKLSEKKQQVLAAYSQSFASMIEAYHKLYSRYPKLQRDVRSEQMRFLFPPKSKITLIDKREKKKKEKNDSSILQPVNTKLLGEKLGLINAGKIFYHAFINYWKKLFKRQKINEHPKT